jgi:hypothetical protein
MNERFGIAPPAGKIFAKSHEFERGRTSVAKFDDADTNLLLRCFNTASRRFEPALAMDELPVRRADPLFEPP